MRFLHLGDLHIGKRVNEFSMLEDQRAVLEQLVAVARAKSVDGVLIAGDFYDKPVPSEQAVKLAGWFLEELHGLKIPVLMVPGNHDSAERLSFLAGMIGQEGIHIAGPYAGTVERVVLEDDAGPVAVHLLPYVTPAEVRHAHPESEARTFDEAVRTVVDAMDINAGTRNVLVAHQLVLGGTEPIRSDSEQASVGGLDEVSAGALDPFDYVALGHLHAPQWIVPGRIRYCGSPLKYSFSEVDQRKCANVVTLGAAGEVELEEVPIELPHDMAELRGTMAEVREQAEARPELASRYVRVILTEPTTDARAKLQDLFPLLMRVEFDYATPGAVNVGERAENIERLDPAEVFADLFRKTNGRDLNDAEREEFEMVMSTVREGDSR